MMKEESPPRTVGWVRKTGESKNSAKCVVRSAFRAGAILLHIKQRHAGNAEKYLSLGDYATLRQAQSRLNDWAKNTPNPFNTADSRHMKQRIQDLDSIS